MRPMLPPYSGARVLCLRHGRLVHHLRLRYQTVRPIWKNHEIHGFSLRPKQQQERPSWMRVLVDRTLTNIFALLKANIRHSEAIKNYGNAGFESRMALKAAGVAFIEFIDASDSWHEMCATVVYSWKGDLHGHEEE